MEPNLVNDPQLDDVLAELRRREPIFHRPEFDSTRADVEAMTADGFWEIGASGQRYSREYVLDVLDARRQNPGEDVWETSDFHCQALAGNVYLLTYMLLQGVRKTRRATIWQRTSQGWQIVFHQGTVIQASSAP